MIEGVCEKRRPEEEPMSMLAAQVAHLLFHRMFAAAGATGVYPGQFVLLQHLSDTPGLSQKELGEKMHIRPSTITVLLRRMEKAELIERRRDENNQRIIRVYMTKKSEDVFLRVMQVTKEIETAMLLDFSQGERHQFREYLQRARSNLASGQEPFENGPDGPIPCHSRKGNHTC
ncbi:MarR family winged helix-turn-helix transcriptional regulator [Papillibacter cinnamivorans]|nr:MarR family transcriptional regulator [Papillibacter cinnamivorans]